jgi:hypothetical protein
MCILSGTTTIARSHKQEWILDVAIAELPYIYIRITAVPENMKFDP